MAVSVKSVWIGVEGGIVIDSGRGNADDGVCGDDGTIVEGQGTRNVAAECHCGRFSM